jgi:hypothetical protein
VTHANSIGVSKPDFNHFVKIYLRLPIEKNRPPVMDSGPLMH